MSGGGYMCVGDAAFFADPAWATGVTIALRTSKMAAETAVIAIQEREFSAEFLSQYDQKYRDWVAAPFNSIRAYNYYYNDMPYVNYLVRRLAEFPDEMDTIGAVLFDYASHEEFLKWGFRVYKDYLKKTGNLPIVDKVSQFDFDAWKGSESV
jgi:flavin-dependent dehydrogenase